VKNNRKEPLTQVLVKDDLTKTFPSPATFTLIDYKTTGTIVKNASYNGKTNIVLIDFCQHPGCVRQCFDGTYCQYPTKWIYVGR